MPARASWRRRCESGGPHCARRAHRLTQTRNSRPVVVLDAGQVVEIGMPTDLAAAKGSYARLWPHGRSREYDVASTKILG